MWIVRLALRRPYTFTVMAILIVLLGIVTIFRMSTDIFPSINIPVVSVIWSYPGVAPEEMEKRFVTVCERAMTTTVNDIEHIESQSYNGVSVIKVFFHEGAKVEAGVAQVTSICQTLLRTMPPGTTPPLIIQYSASNVPILQLGLSSDTLSEQQLYDLGLNFIRTQLSTVQGAQVPLPYGGKVRQIMVDIDPQKLYGKGLSPADVTNAFTAQNVILPGGTQKIGDREYNVRLNNSPKVLDALNNLPIKVVNGATIYIKDIGQVRDGFAVQTNIVSQNGVRSALLTVLKSANASTLDIIKRVKAALPKIQSTLPPELKITQLFDQSLFVRASINGVLREGVIAAALTALMILLFLGSWRSTVVVATSIPLSILCSIIILGALGQTLNIMTLGGLALAVGILVDDATVEIENIHRNLAMKKPMVRAILDGASQIAVPAFVSTLCICIVFVPVFFLSGTAKYLFQPLAMAVIFAMLASYFLSRTVVPTMVKYLLTEHLDELDLDEGQGGGADSSPGSAGDSPAESRDPRDSSENGAHGGGSRGEHLEAGRLQEHASRVRSPEDPQRGSEERGPDDAPAATSNAEPRQSDANAARGSDPQPRRSIPEPRKEHLSDPDGNVSNPKGSSSSPTERSGVAEDHPPSKRSDADRRRNDADARRNAPAGASNPPAGPRNAPPGDRNPPSGRGNTPSGRRRAPSDRPKGVVAWFQKIHHGFNHYFEKLRDRYVGGLEWCLGHRKTVGLVMLGTVLISLCLVPFLGRDFFPTVDSGQFRLHVRAPVGTRLENTSERFYAVEKEIRDLIPPAEIKTILDNIGLPVSGINLAFSDNATVASADGEILVAMNENHKPTADYMRQLRLKLRQDFPDMDFYFAAPDIVSQILNFGLPAPIDIQISGRDKGNYALAQKIRAQVAQIPGAVDVHVHQEVNGPDLFVKVDRSKAQEIGLTQTDVAKTMLISLSSSGQSSPNFWLNYENGVNYQVAIQTPQYKMDTLQDLKNTPVVAPNLARPELLGNLSSIVRQESPVIVNHYNVQPVFDVLANVQGRDLGGVADQINKFVEQAQKKLPRGTFINVRGQVESMNKSFEGLAFGILFAIVLVYFLMVVNFQSWTDPFIIIMALPGALCGIIWMLFITGTTLNVPSLMGAIMAIGVATANSILVVTFANDERCAKEDLDATGAARAAGYTRLRPVIMTALAMIIGMLPMSLGLGEGGEQNAPLGRAVIGGLLVATFATLFFVPVVYSYLRKGEFTCDEDERFEEEANREPEEQPA